MKKQMLLGLFLVVNGMVQANYVPYVAGVSVYYDANGVPNGTNLYYEKNNGIMRPMEAGSYTFDEYGQYFTEVPEYKKGEEPTDEYKRMVNESINANGSKKPSFTMPTNTGPVLGRNGAGINQALQPTSGRTVAPVMSAQDVSSEMVQAMVQQQVAVVQKRLANSVNKLQDQLEAEFDRKLQEVEQNLLTVISGAFAKGWSSVSNKITSYFPFFKETAPVAVPVAVKK